MVSLTSLSALIFATTISTVLFSGTNTGPGRTVQTTKEKEWRQSGINTRCLLVNSLQQVVSNCTWAWTHTYWSQWLKTTNSNQETKPGTTHSGRFTGRASQWNIQLWPNCDKKNNKKTEMFLLLFCARQRLQKATSSTHRSRRLAGLCPGLSSMSPASGGSSEWSGEEDEGTVVPAGTSPHNASSVLVPGEWESTTVAMFVTSFYGAYIGPSGCPTARLTTSYNKNTCICFSLDGSFFSSACCCSDPVFTKPRQESEEGMLG